MPVLGVFCSARAIGCFDFCECGLRHENKRESEIDWGARPFRPPKDGFAVANVLANPSSRSRTFICCCTTHVIDHIRNKACFGGTPKPSRRGDRYPESVVLAGAATGCATGR